MTLYIGIDLGTTYSAASKLDAMGKPVIVHDGDGANITPSIVSFSGDGGVEVGRTAKSELGLNPNVAHRFKRQMGTDWVFSAHGKRYTPSDLSAYVLGKLRKEIEKSDGPITEAVVTVPANFANEAREATMRAAQVAGIQVKYIINEPTAAALYYGSQSGETIAGNYVIYDLGGGTFDVSVIQVDGEDIEVLATDGVSALGGRDFDDALTAIVAEKYKNATGSVLDAEDFTPNDAEELKKDLSAKDKAKVRVSGEGGRVNVEVTRQEFEAGISKWIAQTEMLCEAVLDEAELSSSEIAKVILVGGSTRMPVVSTSVERVFGQSPTRFANPDEVVSLGAALYAAYKSDKSGLNQIQRKALDEINVSEITSKYFGTSAVTMNESKRKEEIQNSIIIQKGAAIPCSQSKTYFTMHDDQRVVALDVTESNAPETDMNFVKVIWEGALELPPGRSAGQPIEVTYSYDENQVMHASFRDVDSGVVNEIDINLAADAASAVDIDRFMVE